MRRKVTESFSDLLNLLSSTQPWENQIMREKKLSSKFFQKRWSPGGGCEVALEPFKHLGGGKSGGGEGQDPVKLALVIMRIMIVFFFTVMMMMKMMMIIIIIITRPWPAFGRQGLVGSSFEFSYTRLASRLRRSARSGIMTLGKDKTPPLLEPSNLPIYQPSNIPTFQSSNLQAF